MNWFSRIKIMNWSADNVEGITDYEVPNTMFSPYLYESQGIEIPLSTSEIDKIFWDAASPGMVTEGMKEFLTSSNYIFRKPHRRIFELALEKADLTAEDVWYIGDQWECDVRGAAGVGITPIWYLGAADSGIHSKTNEKLPLHDEVDSLLQKKQQNDIFKISKFWEYKDRRC